MKFEVKILKICFFVLLLVFVSCNEQMGNLGSKPVAMGRINNLVILADDSLYKGPIGDSILYYFESAYPVLPAEEPIFDLRHMTVEDLNADTYKRELRIYIVVADLSDTTSTTTKMVKKDMGEEKFNRALKDTSYTTSVGNDKWARDQILIYLFANSPENLEKAIRKNFEAIASKINKHDEKNLFATVYGIQDENKLLSADVFLKFGLNIKIPGLYQKAMAGDNFLWLRMNNKGINQSLIFRKFKYESKDQFSKDAIIKLRNEYGKEFIKTSSPDAYMSTNVIDLPVYEYSYMTNNVFTKEIRGIWETENDFMGGPFISYVLHNESKGEIVFIDAFVFAPGKEKRDLIQQLDCIVKTNSFPPVLNN
jgi:hypothetical protein